MEEGVLTNSDGSSEPLGVNLGSENPPEEPEDDGLDPQGRYAKTEKGKETQRKYIESEKGKAALDKYSKSTRHRVAAQKYRESPQGQEKIEEQKRKKAELKRIEAYLKENPGKTIEDYYKAGPSTDV